MRRLTKKLYEKMIKNMISISRSLLFSVHDQIDVQQSLLEKLCGGMWRFPGVVSVVAIHWKTPFLPSDLLASGSEGDFFDARDAATDSNVVRNSK